MSSSKSFILPSADTLNDYEHGTFVLSNLAAKRAKQLRNGAPPLVRIDSNHSLSVALAEIAAGVIKGTFSAEELEEIAAEQPMADAVGESTGLETGLLLPALDEEASGLLAEESDDDSTDTSEANEDEKDLASLLSGEDEQDDENVERANQEEGTLSLSDIASEEEEDDDEDEDSL